MSATDQLLANINEYQELLGFIHKNYPKVLKEWKSKNAVVTSDSRTEPVPEQVT